MKTEIIVSNDSKHSNLQYQLSTQNSKSPIRSYLSTMMPNQGRGKVQEYFHFSSSLLSI